MKKRSLLIVTTAAVLSSGALAIGQGTNRAAVKLPDGDGKALVEARCTSCHGLELVTHAGFARDGWASLFTSMVALPADETNVVADYLAKSFPETPKPPAVVIPGNATISIKEWLVPTLGSRPHDPLYTADGSIWWTGQWANVLGRLDPQDRADERISTQDAEIRTTWAHGRSCGRHLVHRELRESRGQARSEERRDHGISHARSGRSRSPYPHLRSRRQPLVHRPEREHGGPAGPEDGGDQAHPLSHARSHGRTASS